jgi:hypothetical protein
MKRLLTFALGLAVTLFLAAPASAADINLTTDGSSGTDGVAYFQQGSDGASGTGIFPAFSRVQANTDEEGLSTTANILDNTSDDTHNFSIQIADLAVVVNPAGVPAGSYYEFHLDINEAGGGQEFLSLDELIIYSSPLANTAIYPNATFTEEYNLAAGVHVLMDYSLEAGSGKADVTIFIPTSLFAGLAPSTNIYLYSQFGLVGGVYDSSDGFEEWSYRAGEGDTPSVPDGGSTLGLLGLGMLTLGYVRRRFGKN